MELVVGIFTYLDTYCSIRIYGIIITIKKSTIMKILRPEVLNYIYTQTPGGLFQIFDQIYMQALNITPDELDILAEKMNDDELEDWSRLTQEHLPFSKRRQIIKFRNKHLNYFYEKSI
jgi:hypothetical protein